MTADRYLVPNFLACRANPFQAQGREMSIQRHDIGERMSQIVVHQGPTVYLCGQVADRRPASVSDQAKQIFEKIDDYLARVGSDKSKLLFVQVWLSDIRYYEEFNTTWDAWVTPGSTPGRACCQATLASPDMWVELTVTAAL